MDFEDIKDGRSFEHIQGNAELVDVKFEWKGPFIEFPDEGDARVTLFERAAGSTVWEMSVSKMDRMQALVLLDITSFEDPDDG